MSKAPMGARDVMRIVAVVVRIMMIVRVSVCLCVLGGLLKLAVMVAKEGAVGKNVLLLLANS